MKCQMNNGFRSKTYFQQPKQAARLLTTVFYINAILWIARSGAAWRDLPERFGSWKTVYSRFCKWRDDGTLLKIFQALNEEADYENLSIDSTVVKAHQHSAGAKKGR